MLMDADLLKQFHFNSNSVFEGLPQEDLKRIEKNTRYIKYKKGQSIFVEGTYPSGIFFIKDGKVKKFKNVYDGKEQIIYICTKGELLGYSALLSEETYPDSSAALVDSTVGFIPKDAFLQILSKSNQLSLRLLKNLSHEFAVLLNSLVNYSHRTVRERLALMLLILHEKFKEDNHKEDSVYINLSREDLSNIVGTAVETLVRLLRDFKDEKLIKTQGRKIFILDENKLLLLAHIK